MQDQENWKHIPQKELKPSSPLGRSASFLQDATPISFLSLNSKPAHLGFNLVTNKFINPPRREVFFLSSGDSKDGPQGHSV